MDVLVVMPLVGRRKSMLTSEVIAVVVVVVLEVVAVVVVVVVVVAVAPNSICLPMVEVAYPEMMILMMMISV
jgi:hypothetical protein